MERTNLFNEHPFSIAMLTSPNRWQSVANTDQSSTESAIITTTAQQTAGQLSVSTTQGSTVIPAQKSPMSTGSADCSSSESSFSAEVVKMEATGSLSPTSSDDSGRGSPSSISGDVGHHPRTSTPTGAAGSGSSRTEKPSHSYIALISMAILDSTERKLVLSEIYQYIMDRFPFYDNEERAWRNSIRHNLSLNECFIKAGRADNGKGNYWAIHPACVDDFANGDYRRRQARRRARATAAADQAAAALAYPCNFGYMPMTTTASVGPFHPYMHPAAMSFPYMQSPGLPVPAPGLAMPMLPGTLPHCSALPTVTSQTSEGPHQAIPSQYNPAMMVPTSPYPGMVGSHPPVTIMSAISTAPMPHPHPSQYVNRHPHHSVRYSPYGRYSTHQVW